MRKTTDELFQLIQSLSKSEKRHFKLFASRHVIGEENDYIRLFEAINRQEEYDEPKIIKLFSQRPFVKQFSNKKNYLFQIITNALRDYHAHSSINVEIQNLLHEVEILYNKALYQSAKKALLKAKKLASASQHYSIMPEIFWWEKKLLAATFYFDSSANPISVDGNSLEEQLSVLKKIEHNEKYWNIKSLVFPFLRTRGLKTSNLKNIEAIIKKLPEDPSTDNYSIETIIHIYQVYSHYYRLKGDREKLYKNTKKLVELIEKNSVDIVSQHIDLYMSSLHNLLLGQRLVGEYEEFFSTLKKLKAIEQNSKAGKYTHIRQKIFSSSYLELWVYIDIGEFDKGRKIAEDIEKQLDLYDKYLTLQQKLFFHYLISYFYFGLNQYSKALLWLNKILNDSHTNIREDIHSYSRILNLLIHFEMGNDDLLSYITKSTYRFLYKKERLFQFEDVILNFIRLKMPKVNSKDELIEKFKELKKELIKISEDPFEKQTLDFFDFISWLESKIEKKSFAEMKKRNKLPTINLP